MKNSLYILMLFSAIFLCFAGCSEDSGKDYGEPCTEDSECKSGLCSPTGKNIFIKACDGAHTSISN